MTAQSQNKRMSPGLRGDLAPTTYWWSVLFHNMSSYKLFKYRNSDILGIIHLSLIPLFTVGTVSPAIVIQVKMNLWWFVSVIIPSCVLQKDVNYLQQCLEDFVESFEKNIDVQSLEPRRWVIRTLTNPKTF